MNETTIYLFFVSNVLTGVLSSVIASSLYALFMLCIRASERKERARPFEGKYEMLSPSDNQPRGGTVTVKHRHDFWDASPILTVIAKDMTGKEDWSGLLEVTGLSDVARGYYRHPNRRGGTLTFTLAGDSEIMEEGNPRDGAFPKFERVLRRISPADIQTQTV